jgi:hypothetical protein
MAVGAQNLTLFEFGRDVGIGKITPPVLDLQLAVGFTDKAWMLLGRVSVMQIKHAWVSLTTTLTPTLLAILLDNRETPLL